MINWITNWKQAVDGQWNAKVVNGDVKKVEIRRIIRKVHVLIVVSLNGFPTKNKYLIQYQWPDGIQYPGTNVQLGMNGTTFWTFEELEEMMEVVKEAKQLLEAPDDA